MNTSKVGLTVSLIVILLVCLIMYYRHDEVKNNGVYTIATIYNIEYARGGTKFGYSYSLEGKTYTKKGAASYVYLGEDTIRLFIQALIDDPSRSFMTKYRVPNFIKGAPYNGWDTIPDDWKIIKEDN